LFNVLGVQAALLLDIQGQFSFDRQGPLPRVQGQNVAPAEGL